MRSVRMRRVRASSARAPVSNGMTGGIGPLLQDRECDVGVPIQALQSQGPQTDRFQRRERFPGPQRVVQLVEGEHGSLWHACQEVLQRHLRWFVEITIET